MDDAGGSRPVAAEEQETMAVSPAVAPPPAPDTATTAEILFDPEAMRRDRLLAGMTLILGIGLCLALPFALQAGSEFFLPLTAALVIAIAMVPALEWLERHRVPAPLAALFCVLIFLVAANIALASIVVPATQWVQLLPERIDRVQTNLAPLLDLYSSLERFANRMMAHIATEQPARAAQAVGTAPPRSLVELAATSAPSAIIEMFFSVLVIYFFLSGWTRLRRNAITSRSSFGGAMATARVIQDVVDDVSAYLATITAINIVLGLITAAALHALGMPFPLMWGGIVALLNYVPYFGPVISALLVAIGGLMTFGDIGTALAAPAIMYGLHLIEANVVTPLIVGHRLLINPVLILISISFWGWVWGTIGALLAVPLLIIIQTIVQAAGKPDIAGFLFEHGTLVRQPRGRGRKAVDPPG